MAIVNQYTKNNFLQTQEPRVTWSQLIPEPSYFASGEGGGEEQESGLKCTATKGSFEVLGGLSTKGWVKEGIGGRNLSNLKKTGLNGGRENWGKR